MRKFNVRWWVTEELTQWRYMQACGDYSGGFAMFPHEPVWQLRSTGRELRFFGETRWSLK